MVSKAFEFQWFDLGGWCRLFILAGTAIQIGWLNAFCGASTNLLVIPPPAPQNFVRMRLGKIYPLLIVLSIELAFTLFLVFGHRGVIGHDAFAYFNLQYYFLNNSVQTGETAQWIPLLAHGFVSNWWYAVQAGILQNALLGFGELNAIFRGLNFLPIYYAGIFFEVIVLAAGVYLLGQRYFESKLTILFVAVTAVGSVSWFTTVFANLHLYFALPLIFYLIHTLFETGKWRYFFFAGNLFAVRTLGDAPYFLPFLSFVVVLYTTFYIAFFRNKAIGEIRQLFRRWFFGLVSLVLVLLTLYLVYGSLMYGTEDIVNYDVGRARDGRNVSLESFLTFGTNSNFRWAELVSRVSPVMDYSLYFGYIALGFAGIAIFTERSRAFLLVASTAFVLLLVSSSTPLASLLYYIWPGMQFFRHLSLGSTIVRLLLCFLAGFGFEALLIKASANDGQYVGKVRMAILLLFASASGLLKFSYDYHYARALVWLSVRGVLPLDWNVLGESYLPHELFKASMWCLGATGFFLALFFGRMSRKKLALTAILFQGLDVYTFRIDLSLLRTIPLTREEYRITNFQPMPYDARRELISYPSHHRGKSIPQKRYPYGDPFWTVDLLALADGASNSGRTDHWLLPLDDLLRTYWGEAIRDLESKPKAYKESQPIQFPFGSPSAQRVSGITEDKIQIFSRAHFVGNEQRLSTMMASEEFGGNILLVSGPRESPNIPLKGYDRVHRSYQVVKYDANNIWISVEDATGGDWLYYADCWHPFWSATVNGNEVPYYKANLAYKAVKLEPGQNLVHFRFNSKKLAIFQRVLSWNALLWLFLPFYFVGCGSAYEKGYSFGSSTALSGDDSLAPNG